MGSVWTFVRKPSNQRLPFPAGWWRGRGCRWNRDSCDPCLARRGVWRGGGDRGTGIGKYDRGGQLAGQCECLQH
jgi:hypothetical protein